MTRPAGSVALTTLYLDNVLRVRHPPGRRPKGVQKYPRLRKYLNLQAEGGRFEPAQGRHRVTRASALKSLCCNGFAGSQASATAPKTTLKNPDLPPKNRTGPGWSGSCALVDPQRRQVWSLRSISWLTPTR
jgi:hypothetical protein